MIVKRRHLGHFLYQVLFEVPFTRFVDLFLVLFGLAIDVLLIIVPCFVAAR